jgi:hypothetical protein
MTNRHELIRQSNQLRREENELKREEASLTQQARGSSTQRAALQRNHELRNKNKRQLRDVTHEIRKLEQLAAAEVAATAATAAGEAPPIGDAPPAGETPAPSAPLDFPAALPPLEPPPARDA